MKSELAQATVGGILFVIGLWAWLVIIIAVVGQ